MFNFNKALELPPQLQWKYANEPELLGWTIRARNYNTFVANCMFAFMSLVIMGWSYFLYATADANDSVASKFVFSLCFYMFFSFVISWMTHQRMNIAYRFTESGVEYCKWKDFPKWVLPFVKWFAGITAVMFIFLATLDPAFLIGALIGPGGMGLMYLSMANSKSYRELHTQYHNHFFHWDELTKLTIATNRDMVEVDYSVPKEGSIYMIEGSLYVFFKRDRKNEVVTLIKKHLPPAVPCIVGKVDVLN
ncbi:hypothetical protein [Pseudomonas sp. P1.8]|uniref:hypothetical protein n=1 Tax=Pseudomonas sp. P1.8 TaxID=1699310 RepID=UPI00069E9262|nr:hypothetical protein [Pseudomonas sp. P1.8]